MAFAAPADTTLDANTSYFVLVYRSGSTTGTLRVTGSSSEDSGGHSDWAIADTGHYLDNGTWTTLGTELYGIRVNGAARKSNSTNANLSALTASTHTSSTGTFTSHPLAPSTFAATTTSYMALVGNAQTHLKLTPTVNASGATVKVGKGTSLATVTSGSASAAIALSLGSNVITVEVTAADGITKKTYTVTVTRRAAGQVWAATFTPEELSWGIGCMSKSECDSQLTQNSFTIGDQSYHFLELAVRDNGSLFFSLSAANLALTNLKFCVGSTAFEFSIFAVQFQFWINSGVTWTAGTPVSLSIGTSCPRQTTTPTQSTDATLSGLKATSSTSATRTFSALGIGTFAAATTSYTVSVTNSVTHVKLTPTVSDSGATVKVGRGTSLTAVASGSASAAIALSVGANAIKVEVTAEDGTTQTYTLTVTRKAATPNAPTRLGVSAGDARLDLGWTAPPGPVTGYDVHYTSASKTGQGAVADDADASGSDASTAWVAVTRSGTAASQAISSLSNGTAYRVRVRATNSGQNGPWAFGTGKPKSRDATLSALTASSSDAADGTFPALDVGTFASGTAAFAATVENAVTHVKLTPTTSGPAATVKVGKGSSLAAVTSGSASGAIPLDVGPNEIKVEVTAGDGTTTRTYTVTVTRAAASSDATLSALSGRTSTDGSDFGGTLDIGTFASGTVAYTATVGNAVTHVKLTPTVSDPAATVKVGRGTNLAAAASGFASAAMSLSVGENALKVEVTAEDGTARTYAVTVTRQEAPVAVSLSATPNPVREGSPVTVTATLAKALEEAVTIPLTVTRGTSEDGDHGSLASISLPAGFTSATGTVTTSSDDDGDDETFTVALGSLSSGLTAGSTSSVQVTITDRGLQRTAPLTLSGLSGSTSRDGSDFGGTLDIGTFAPGTTEYAVTIGNAFTHVRLTATAGEPGATLKVGKGSSLAAVADGSASGAIPLSVGTNALKVEVTAGDGTTKRTYTVTVTRAAPPLTARLRPAIAEHDGETPFMVELVLSNSLGWGSRWPTAASFDVKGGSVESVRAFRSAPDRFHVYVRPNSRKAVAVTLSGGRACDAAGAVCTADGRALSHSPNAAVAGPDGALSSDADLSALSAEGAPSAEGSWSALGIGTFAPATTAYSATVPHGTTHARLTATAADLGATLKAGAGSSLTAVTGGTASGAIALSVGANALKLEVTAEDGTVKTYAVTVTRQEAPVAVSLSAAPNPVVEGSPVTVTATLAKALEKAVTIPLTVTRGTSEDGDHGSLASIELPAGFTSVDGTISTADDADGDDETFTVALGSLPSGLAAGTASSVEVTITDSGLQRTAPLTLSGLSGSTSRDGSDFGGTLDIGTFAPGTTEYAATVGNTVTHVKLTATAGEPGATLTVGTGSPLAAVADGTASGAIPLSVGANALKVEVTAEDGTVTTYTVTVTREERALSSDATLSGLSAEAKTEEGWSALDVGTFASATTAYAATVPNGTTHVRLTATAADANATLKAGAGSSLTAVTSGLASGAIALSVGANALKVEVTAEDGTTSTYTVAVTRQAAPLTAAFEKRSLRA